MLTNVLVKLVGKNLTPADFLLYLCYSRAGLLIFIFLLILTQFKIVENI